ncbi:MAG: flavohemoglobin expression-modulating QEGLA motif protein [Fibrobacterota bacterium]
MREFSVDEIIRRIRLGQTFEGCPLGGAFFIRVHKYVPYLATSVHSGNRLRDSLQGNCLLSEYERWYEEDPCTDDFIDALPLVIQGRDSRFAYDLNRPADTAIYETAWGKTVWKRPLSSRERERSLKNYRAYYRILDALVTALEERFGRALVFDIHSYNWKRWERETPLYNIGVENVDMGRFSDVVETWRTELSRGKGDLAGQAVCNDVFFGRGYNLLYLKEHHPESCVLATEIKKIYCDESNGETYPQIIRDLRMHLKRAVLNTAYSFADTMTAWGGPHRERLLHDRPEKTLLDIDRRLYRLMKPFELLPLLNPLNMNREKRLFFKSRFRSTPSFAYRAVKLDPFLMKRELLNLPVEKIRDISLQKLYTDAVHGFVDQIDLISSRDTERFLYNSLRYFGEPSQEDIDAAQYLLRLPAVPDEGEGEPGFSSREAQAFFENALREYGFSARCEVRRNVVADVMVNNRRRAVIIKKDARFTRRDLRNLVHHEIGVHMLTTMNALKQPLHLLRLGLPVNTSTQEGLAVLAEYLAGTITLGRLKRIALRVIAVARMSRGSSFSRVFQELVETWNIPIETAFTVTTRVFRGGGLTKDYLYLAGFARLFRRWMDDDDLTPLLLGKVSDTYYTCLSEMIDRGLLNKPDYFPEVFTKEPAELSRGDIYGYILQGLL